ncbi:efflux RND transporter periplasmic adaptor subunit [Xenorhabdus griffiniae]|uniref:efflux RND transporter periplasmic adaptor subunit n=1 Tax=Xenorhabdus griffiniae TaxID=351672 RepID=UPI0023591868|nr:efflux RND transporter periplasmic adaptor subunit [Xenorhabdus griffiniae]MDC9605040.1 efflux RND transporter periplasmic adaptor subunit [Xenorhabdus griffiniae]
MTVGKREITQFEVLRKTSNDSLKIRAVVVPDNSVSISTEIGGIVSEIIKKPSQNILKNEEIVKLSNFNFTLNNSVMLADVTDKLNNLINIKTNLQSDYRDINDKFLDATKELKTIKNKLERYNNITNRDYVSKEVLRDLKIKMDHWSNVYQFYKKLKYEQDKNIKQQLKEINDAVKKQKKLSEIIENGFEQLSIKSTISGNISSLNLILGQRLKPGEQIAVIDDLSSFYFESEINEYYLDKITYTSPANLIYNNNKIPLSVKLISSEVNNGTFKVRFVFKTQKNFNFKRGQSVDIAVNLSENRSIFSVPSSMIFYLDNKYYVFILDKNQKSAQRTLVSIGSDDGINTEIKDGISENQVIVSFGKSNFVKNNTVRIE